MERPTPDLPHDADPLKGGLKHNPFAALRGESAHLSSAPARETASVPAPASSVSHERVTVRMERAGRGGKTVTIAEGPGLAGHDVESLSREIARGLGAGARVEGGELFVQGDQRDRLCAWLASHGFAAVARGN